MNFHDQGYEDQAIEESVGIGQLVNSNQSINEVCMDLEQTMYSSYIKQLFKIVCHQNCYNYFVLSKVLLLCNQSLCSTISFSPLEKKAKILCNNASGLLFFFFSFDGMMR